MDDDYLRKRISTILRTRTCTCLFPRCGLQHLPTELIVNILDTLPPKAVVMWQSVSKQFRDIIANSITLQYKIECCIADVLPEPFCITRNKSEQINVIREWTRAWKNIKWKLELAEESAKAQGISLDNPPSIIRGAVQRVYDFDDLAQYAGYGWDAQAAVVVIAELDRNSRTIRLTPLDIVTRKRHSEWASDADPMVLEFPHGEPNPWSVNVSVCGDTVICHAVYENHPLGAGTVTEYWWFVWQDGSLCMHFWSDSMATTRFDNFSFLSDDYIIATLHYKGKVILAGFDAEESVPGYHAVEEIIYDASMLLDLPPVHWGSLSPIVSIDFQPNRYRLPKTYQNALFTPANSSAIVQIHLPLTHSNTGLTSYLDLLIPLPVIMHHVDRGGRGSTFDESLDDITTIPSSQWCRCVRVFEACPTRTHAVCNSRYITKEVDPESGISIVVVYDFSPLQTTLYDLGRDEVVDVVLNEDCDPQRECDSYGCSPVPYRRMKTQIILEDGENPQITEDSIVIAHGTGSGSRR